MKLYMFVAFFSIVMVVNLLNTNQMLMRDFGLIVVFLLLLLKSFMQILKKVAVYIEGI